MIAGVLFACVDPFEAAAVGCGKLGGGVELLFVAFPIPPVEAAAAVPSGVPPPSRLLFVLL